MGEYLAPDIQSATEPPPPDSEEDVLIKRNLVLGIGPLSVSSMTHGAASFGVVTVTVVTTTAHGLQDGQRFTIAGADQTDYNGIFTILTIPSTTSFTFQLEAVPATPATGTITMSVTPVDTVSAEIFETNVGKLVLDECDNSFPNFIETPELQIRALGDYNIVLVPTVLDSQSDIVNPVTAGHKFKLYVGNVGTAPDDGVYRFHLLWARC